MEFASVDASEIPSPARQVRDFAAESETTLSEQHLKR